MLGRSLQSLAARGARALARSSQPSAGAARSLTHAAKPNAAPTFQCNNGFRAPGSLALWASRAAGGVSQTPGTQSHMCTNIQKTVPTMDVAKAMPRYYCELSNEALLTYCAQGEHEAHRERLQREIMAVDNVDYHKAAERVEELEKANKIGMQAAILPYKIGITIAILGGGCSIPLCFHLPTVMWFNDKFVTAEVAEPQDLETWLEVGSWAWNWMEPPLGQISFFLLTLQFARNQMLNLGAKPYTHWLQQYRARRLKRLYPQYSGKIIEDFAISDSWT